jgi:hypothetical protein
LWETWDEALSDEGGVNHGFGGTATYARVMREEDFDVEVDAEKEVLGVVGTVVLGVVVTGDGFGLTLEVELKDFIDWTRLTEGESSWTYTFRLRGVVEGMEGGSEYWRERGSGLS